ncbi:uncharacterized protein B0P05DRAFT_528555 [Gilbertella persicaria]|uniref:Uncharacterized protein n=1 Tax=Rhizopus stolonifer TaxID=4846 RepID=A0A367INV9_RHIST|nr:uncharacterized protein B0P05DRAFT_528555 [Gilbertella persicaria]KAI8091050.1 hypothetical protein B0P05DRAFT_528555 [Gilbertella persicaria]RCH79367.1 hypothetical protein CU098_002916 [Rhizopus stolonifer]
MSLNSRYRERKYNTSDNDRLLRALSQPVQAWDKQWAPLSTSKTLQTYKWVKSERAIQFEPDEESEEEPEPMETESSTLAESTENQNSTLSKQDTIPGGPSSLITNKAISALQQDDDDDEQRSQTPKLDDISDDEENRNNEDEEDNDVDSINDPSKHPALAPHAQARMTDDDLTDSAAATPQTEGTPMMEEDSTATQPHPLSQEILSGTMQTDAMDQQP